MYEMLCLYRSYCINLSFRLLPFTCCPCEQVFIYFNFFYFRDENLDYTVLQTINKWLQAIGMDKYTSNFVDQGFATPRQILELTESDLEALGIGPIGHRKKIYKAIKNTQTQV